MVVKKRINFGAWCKLGVKCLQYEVLAMLVCLHITLQVMKRGRGKQQPQNTSDCKAFIMIWRITTAPCYSVTLSPTCQETLC